MATDRTTTQSSDDGEAPLQELETDDFGVRLSQESQSLFKELPKGPSGGSNNFVPVEPGVLPQRIAHDPNRHTVAVLDDYRRDDMVLDPGIDQDPGLWMHGGLKKLND